MSDERRWIVAFISTAPDGTSPVTTYYGPFDDDDQAVTVARELERKGPRRNRCVSCEVRRLRLVGEL